MFQSHRKVVSPYRQVYALSYRPYSSAEIRRLSVKEITNPEVFDFLLHPIAGGLYDGALGPYERGDLCSTCSLPDRYCPGHMGHISLPICVYNPVFFNITYQLVQATCIHCHRVLCGITLLPAKIAQAQLKCLRFGNLEAASGVVQFVNKQVMLLGPSNRDPDSLFGGVEETAKRLKRSWKTVDAELSRAIDTYVDNAVNGTDNLTLDSESKDFTRNSLEFRQDIFKQFMRESFLKRKAKCNHCSLRLPVLSKEGNRAIKLEESRQNRNEDKFRVSTAFPSAPMLGFENFSQGSQTTKKHAVTLESTPAKLTVGSARYLSAKECREHLREVWNHDKELLAEMFPGMCLNSDGEFAGNDEEYPFDVLFIDAVPVPPTKYRPISKMGDRTFENMQTAALKKVLQAGHAMKILVQLSKPDNAISELNKDYVKNVPGVDLSEKLDYCANRLQIHVNALYDSESDVLSLKLERLPGLRQLIEKKAGILRKHMMGKRVNFAARSVISPDPYIEIDEVGIPEVFASRLTFPEPVNSRNLSQLKHAVVNGPHKYPGATYVVNEDGSTIMLSDDPKQRQAMSKQLFKHASDDNIKGVKQVMRHLKNGDILLMNRQPTLHKPSIMAHRAHVLEGEKTMRLNYATCKTYNADFDGDEMNAHFAQNYIARSEGYNIAVPYQYLVPKDGSPITGLIQDHVISSVLLTVKDTFLSREDYQHLVFSAFPNSRRRFKLLRPAMIKPVALYSGKQVVSTVILNVIPEDRVPLSIVGKAKTHVKNWRVPGGKNVDFVMSESEVVIRQGELLCGVLDKADHGPTAYGLVHCCFEAYGPKVAANLLSCFTRLFTTFLQIHGFTLGVEDILLRKTADKKRQSIIKQIRSCGPLAASKAFHLPVEIAAFTDPDGAELLNTAFAKALASHDKDDVKLLDYEMKTALDELGNKVTSSCIPDGLMKNFPRNSLQLMIESGAKGSLVNHVQISCMLGQIELEGARPPMMISGRSLPSFRPYDPSPRAGGFVDQRFLTGIRPQEYFFHCMAGREGLIDTAVKTSRSGYLQRCIIKHLEGLVVAYDLTVRNSADNSVIQFQYGEDSLDIGKVPFLSEKQFPFLIENADSLLKRNELEQLKQVTGDGKKPRRKYAKIVKWQEKFGEEVQKVYLSGFLFFQRWRAFTTGQTDVPKDVLIQEFRGLSAEESERFQKKMHQAHRPDPVSCIYRPDHTFGSLPEAWFRTVKSYIKSKSKDGMIQGSSVEMNEKFFEDLISWKAYRALVEPGEPVGLLAAQSIGEPSTQMTLNTFHFAGRGEMNVTLGIPRLREILMVASKNIATPSAHCPAHAGVSREQMEFIQRRMDRIYLKNVLKDIQMLEKVSVSNDRCRRYTIRFHLMKPKRREPNYQHLSCGYIIKMIERGLLRRLGEILKKRLLEIQKEKSITSRKAKEAPRFGQGGGAGDEEEAREVEKDQLDETIAADAPAEGDESSDEEVVGDDVNASDERQQLRHKDDANEYLGEEEESEAEEATSEDEMKPEEDKADGDEPGANQDLDETVNTTDAADGAQEQDLEWLLRSSLKHIQPEPREDRVKTVKLLDKSRIQVALSASKLIEDYQYDCENELWCEVTYKLGLLKSKMDLTSLVDSAVAKFVVQAIPGIEKCILTEERGQFVLKTQGVNLAAFYNYADFLDVNRIYCNDIHVVARTYGIEAAARTIINETKLVFGSYGINVDGRHLSLIADYMTHVGLYRPLNRGYMDGAPSPLQKMTFETSMNFLKSVLLSGQGDELKSPSSCLVVGKLTKGGTGSFDVLAKITAHSHSKSSMKNSAI